MSEEGREAPLRDAVVIGARLRADSLRVDESRDAHIRRGAWRRLRRGLPSSGAEEGVTYHDVEVGIWIEGEAEVTHPGAMGRAAPEEQKTLR